ncbi:hypothetical protein [Corallococcus exercitus]|uniref:Uncharacterized protein n=1 Tax=Corallococcus exercitus TaxID=2316736 RepID=A0A7Y4NDC5_9BACT|nr:hypothetical protein [Corallococcus exercitus]NOK09789.1 hypothetical protein [Corallococcus exercitus]
MFAIPDGAGGWLNTSPQTHGEYLKNADAAPNYGCRITLKERNRDGE